MQRIHQTAAVCFIVFSAFVVWESIGLEYYTKLGPGSGFFPFWLGTFLGVMGIVWLVKVSLPKGKPADGDFLPERSGIIRILAILASMISVIAFMNLLGFQITIFIFLAFLLRILGKQSILITIVVSVVGSVGVYHLFGGYLDVQLPASAITFLSKLGL